MSGDEIAEYRDGHLDEYVAQRVASGQHPDDARRVAEESFAASFPDGSPAPGHLHLRIVDGGERVGTLWLGPQANGRPEAYWVWSIEIFEPHRGRGLGREAMRLAEAEALEHGAEEIGLNVFGHNAVARRLYESLDYQTMAVQMRKELHR